VGYSKRQFCEAAFAEIGLAGYVFDMQPQNFEQALRRLDAMMAEWNAKGIRLGYPLPGSPQFSDINAESEVPDSANEAIICNLGIRIAAGYGKGIMPQTLAIAKQAYNTLLSRATAPIPQQLPGTMPSGAGNKPWRYWDNPYLQPPVDPVQAGPDGVLELN
jgi:hypothetical protein